MENNNESSVEIAFEPKIYDRFGFSKEKHSLSPRAIKFCAIATGISLGAVFLMRTPEKLMQKEASVKAPETYQINSEMDRKLLETYSPVEENNRLREKNKKSQVVVALRIPGLQKIDRRNAGKIPPGSLVKAVLVTGASNGPISAEITEALRVQGETLLPVGSTLMGSGQSSNDRLIIRFNQVVFKDGSFENIQGYAADVSDKMLGLKGSQLGTYVLKYATAIGLNFVGGMAEGLEDREIVGQQVYTKPTAKNALLNGASKATLEMANESMTDIKNSAPIIYIKAGQEIFVIFQNGQ